jgi:hypothetical protein
MEFIMVVFLLNFFKDYASGSFFNNVRIGQVEACVD